MGSPQHKSLQSILEAGRERTRSKSDPGEDVTLGGTTALKTWIVGNRGGGLHPHREHCAGVCGGCPHCGCSSKGSWKWGAGADSWPHRLASSSPQMEPAVLQETGLNQGVWKACWWSLAKAEILHILFRIWVMVLELRVMTINKASWNIIHPSVSFWLSYVSLGQCS